MCGYSIFVCGYSFFICLYYIFSVDYFKFCPFFQGRTIDETVEIAKDVAGKRYESYTMNLIK